MDVRYLSDDEYRADILGNRSCARGIRHIAGRGSRANLAVEVGKLETAAIGNDAGLYVPSI